MGTPLITLLGPTASGKTSLAAFIAHEIGCEIISADSRQVFRGMDIGTGKDLADYVVQGSTINFHLIDIAEAGSEFSLHTFIKAFSIAYSSIISSGKIPLMCGGTGLYLDAVLRNYQLIDVQVDSLLRNEWEKLTTQQLTDKLATLKTLHNQTDITDRERLYRALEIGLSTQNTSSQPGLPDFSRSLVLGLRFERETERQRITSRLLQRLENGMLPEVENLLNKGVSPAMLKAYGLEYKFITMYLEDLIHYDQMVSQLNTAIHQFAKRQMTWFRRMERNGVNIHWLRGEDGVQVNLNKVLSLLENSSE